MEYWSFFRILIRIHSPSWECLSRIWGVKVRGSAWNYETFFINELLTATVYCSPFSTSYFVLNTQFSPPTL